MFYPYFLWFLLIPAEYIQWTAMKQYSTGIEKPDTDMWKWWTRLFIVFKLLNSMPFIEYFPSDIGSHCSLG